MSRLAPDRMRFRDELRASTRLAAPLIAGHLSTGLIGLIDAVIAGRHGTATLAAVSVGTALFWLPLLVPMGTLIAVPASVSQLDGAGRREEIAPLFRQALWLALALGLGMFVFLSLLPAAGLLTGHYFKGSPSTTDPARFRTADF